MSLRHHRWTPDPPEVRLVTSGSHQHDGTSAPASDVVGVTIVDPQAPVRSRRRSRVCCVDLAADVYDHCHDDAGAVLERVGSVEPRCSSSARATARSASGRSTAGGQKAPAS